MPRPKSGKPQNNAPQALNERHKTMARYAARGAPQKEIAEAFEVHPSTVSAVFSSPLFEALVERYRKEMYGDTATRKLEEAAGDAADSLIDVARHGEEPQRVAASRAILGYSVVSAEAKLKAETAKEAAKEGSKAIHIHLTAADFMQLQKGDVDEDALGDVIDLAPQPIKPITQLLAELQAAETEALENP